MSRIAWIDATAGVAGDMLLGALHDAGALAGFPELVAELPGLSATVEFHPVRRAGLAATAARVTAPAGQPERRLADILDLLSGVPLEPAVVERAAAVFRRLATAEAAVHGVDVEAVHFHEVGAVDAIVDVLGGCLGLHRLEADRLVASPVGVGSGTASTEHGRLPVPTPAVLRLLADASLTAAAGPAAFESATPTGVALLAEWATGSGGLPAMHVATIGVGAGTADVADHPNVVRVVSGSAAETTAEDGWLHIEANVDDLDPRLWPSALEALLAAGAADAWLSPIQMKKGRPAHTVHALVEAQRLPGVGDALLTHTSTIGFRSHPVGKHAADRRTQTVTVAGREIRVKVTCTPDGTVLSATPEWEDVRAAAELTGVPARRLLALAQAAAATLLGG